METVEKGRSKGRSQSEKVGRLKKTPLKRLENFSLQPGKVVLKSTKNLALQPGKASLQTLLERAEIG